jgi:branched-chain amino acid transport system permease protein
MKASAVATPRNTFIGTVIRKRWIGKIFLIVIGVLASMLLIINPIRENPVLFLQQVVNGLQLGFVYALIALGYTMVYGIVRLINFAHGDVFMVGAFTSFFAIARFGLNTWPSHVFPGIPGWLSTTIGVLTVILLSMVTCAVLAFTIERIAYKPLRNAPRISALITAIGVSFFLEYFGALPFVYTANFVTYKRPFPVQTWAISTEGFTKVSLSTPAPPNSIMINNIQVIIIIISIVLVLLLNYFVRQTRTGKAMRASAYDKPTSRLMGINVDRVISVTFAIGAALAGAAGVLYAIAYNQVYFVMGILPGLKAFVAAVLGGIGSIPGALVGALIIGQAENLSAAYISSPMRDAVAFTILVLVLLIRPTGIFGEPTREKA